MTVFGWDTSHYDGLISTAIAAQARAEGIHLFTAKIGEGTSYDDPNDKTALAAARDAGIECLAGYHVVRSVDPAAQVDYLISLADRDEPWWRDFEFWSWQSDVERWSYDNVSAATGIEFSQRLRDKTQRQVLLYGSHGQYGDQLAAWDGPLWNADYTSKPPGPFAGMYPGDDWMPLYNNTWRGGWAPYSGKAPALLQYTSSAVIAGLTTCDANAFRGTLDQLKGLITGGTDVALKDDPDGVWMLNRIQAMAELNQPQYGPEAGKDLPFVTTVKTLLAQVAANGSGLTALSQKVAALQAAGAPTQDQVDAAILKAMQDPGVQAGIGAAIATHLHVS